MEKARILLVDDELSPKKDGPNGSYMWYYTQALREAGFEVVEAVGPDFALQRLTSKRLKFDLVIIDIMLPPGKAFGGEDTLNGLRLLLTLRPKRKAERGRQKTEKAEKQRSKKKLRLPRILPILSLKRKTEVRRRKTEKAEKQRNRRKLRLSRHLLILRPNLLRLPILLLSLRTQISRR